MVVDLRLEKKGRTGRYRYRAVRGSSSSWRHAEKNSASCMQVAAPAWMIGVPGATHARPCHAQDTCDPAPGRARRWIMVVHRMKERRLRGGRGKSSSFHTSRKTKASIRVCRSSPRTTSPRWRSRRVHSRALADDPPPSSCLRTSWFALPPPRNIFPRSRPRRCCIKLPRTPMAAPLDDAAAPPLPENPGASSALRSRNYRLFFVGQMISLVGTFLTQIATDLAGLPPRPKPVLGTVAFAGQIPLFFLAPFGGVWVDRWNKRRPAGDHADPRRICNPWRWRRPDS